MFTYAKALVPIVIGALFTILEPIGFTPDMTLENAITLVLTSALVYLVPNKQA